MTDRETGSRYESPLMARYASAEMAAIFSPRHRARIWRQLWIALAEAERELGLEISDEAIAEMQGALEEIDLDRIAELEAETRHETMAHIRHYGEVAPSARGVIHLGATSAFVMDNADLIQHREALQLVRRRLLSLIGALRDRALEHRDAPTIGYTHLQPAQPTTIGKRISLWCQDLVLDLEELDFRLAKLRFRGARGATGTEASFLMLLDGDSGAVDRLNALIAEKMAFSENFAVSSQTYPRKVDAALLSTLSGIAASLSKFATDIRILQNFGELEEPFGSAQVGSSAMPQKRNPMRCERICSLARHVMVLALDPAFTAATQWLERSLDDSANKRIAIPEAYLCTDAILRIAHNVAAGLNVYPTMAMNRLQQHLPMLAAEPVLMAATQRGGDRQELHEVIRRHAMAATERVRAGEASDIVDRLANDSTIGIERAELERIIDPSSMVGRAASQVDRFIADVVDPLLEANRDSVDQATPTLNV